MDAFAARLGAVLCNGAYNVGARGIRCYNQLTLLSLGWSAALAPPHQRAELDALRALDDADDEERYEQLAAEQMEQRVGVTLH